MLPDGRRLGAHLPLADGLVRAVERAHEIGADALQVFADNPSAWKRRTEPPRDAPAFRARLAELDFGPTAIHAAYLVNLASPDETAHARSVELLAAELRIAPAFAAGFVNAHTGSHLGSGVEAGAARVADGVRLALAEVDDGPGSAMLVLENSAGAGFGIGRSVEELAAMAEAAAAIGVPERRLGFCLDTAHAWGAGYRISEPEEVDRLLEAFDAQIGLERLVMIHLNDSKAMLGTNTDRHQHLGAGSIGPRGLARVIVHPGLAHVAYYLETPGMEDGYDAINVRRAFALATGAELDDLPEGALELKGARARSTARSAEAKSAKTAKKPAAGTSPRA